MAYIQVRQAQDGKIRYRVQVRLKGFPLQSETFERKTDARRWAQQTESAILEGRHFKTTEAKKRTLRELIERYIRDVLPMKPKSIPKQTMQLNWWKEELGHHVLADITPALIVERRDQLTREITIRGKQRSPSTVVRYMAALSHAFSIAVREWGWLESNPLTRVSRPREPRGRVRFLSDEERARLLETCKESNNPYLYPVVVLALSTGMRHGEILGLTWGDVDLKRGMITLQETKNGERRVVPLTGHAHDILTEFNKVRRLDSQLLFPGKKGFVGVKGQKPIDLRGAWLAALKKAIISDFRFHDLRHSAASYLAMNGASASEIAAVLGHKTLQMVKRYAHLSEPHTTLVVTRMNEKIFRVVTRHD